MIKVVCQIGLNYKIHNGSTDRCTLLGTQKSSIRKGEWNVLLSFRNSKHFPMQIDFSKLD